MKKTYILIFLTVMTAGMLLGSSAKATSNSSVADTGLTKMSQLLQPAVISKLDSNGDGKAEITGIDPGAGMMVTLESFLQNNASWSDWTVTESSGAGMTAALAKAYAAQDPIVVTLWSPHWAFSKFNLTYLQDDIGLYGASDNVVTLARQNLNTTSTDAQHLYNILTRFHWTQADCNSVMLAIQDGASPATAAQDWIDANTATVNSWIGSDSGSGTYTYGYVAWSDTIANSNVLNLVLQQAGYTVDFTQVTPAVLYEGLSKGTIDFTTSAWLPQTQANYWNAGGYNQTVDWIRTNLEGAKVGLVVPNYMTLPSYWASSASSSSTSASNTSSTSSSTTNTPGFEAPLLFVCIATFSVYTLKKRNK